MDVPKLDDWLTFPEVGQILGCTKQNVHKMAFEERQGQPPVFKTLRAVGSKPVYVISEAEVRQVHEARQLAKAAREERKTAKAQRAAEKVAVTEE